MSQRNIRKAFGGPQLPQFEESSDEEYEPSTSKKFTRNVYEGLEVSSASEDDNSSRYNASEEDIPDKPKPEGGSKKKKYKKKKRQCATNEGLDEIDRSVQEVNAMLGEPEEEPVELSPTKNLEKLKKQLFTIKQKHLQVNIELNRMFGPDEDEDPKKRGRQPNLRVISQRGFIIESDKMYKNNGLNMVLLEKKNDLKYFVFSHNWHYQNLHTSFLYLHNQRLTAPSPRFAFPLEESRHRMHVEGLLELADQLYTMEEYTQGNSIIEEIINHMQHCAHPFFSVTDMRTRLEYKHVENRAFHIALLKYLHMVTNKACHRTALELGKLLLNLDPSDPLAVLFIIDTVAIRAREYEWLIDAVDIWKQDRDAGFLFNIQYSYALAHYHVAKKNNETYQKADELIQQAMLKFPSVVNHVLQNVGTKNNRIRCSPLFSQANKKTSSNLRDLIALYTKFIWQKLSQGPVLKWLMRNAEEVAEKYEYDGETQDLAKSYANIRMNLFQTYPPEILRHLNILTPLSVLITDGAVPMIGKHPSYDPIPPEDGIDRYEEMGIKREPVNYFEMFTSILPDRDLQDASMEYV